MFSVLDNIIKASLEVLQEMKIDEQELEKLKIVTTQIEFLHPRYGINIWLENQKLLTSLKSGNEIEEHILQRSLTMAYPFLDRVMEKKYSEAPQRWFDGNSSPHRMYSLLKNGKCKLPKKVKMEHILEHLIDKTELGSRPEHHFSCPFSICLERSFCKYLTDNLSLVRYILRGRVLYCLEKELCEVKKNVPKLDGVTVGDLLSGWGPYLVPAGGIWKDYVSNDDHWAPVDEYNDANFKLLIQDQKNWKAYRNALEHEGIRFGD
jgi:hypothetical protein